MLSRSSSAGIITTYAALPLPKQQKKCKERRRSVKPPRTLPRLKKEQSTLTQIDFVSTPSMYKELIAISDSEDEFKEPQPKKKRRKSKFAEREKGQGTLTQLDWDSASKPRRFEVDDDGVQIWEDYCPENVAETVEERQKHRKRKLPWLGQDVEDVENQELPPEIPETSQLVSGSPSKTAGGIAKEVEVKHAGFETPRTVRFKEVPSSQTPPSTKLSKHNSWRTEDTQRSPLKERNTNVQTSMSHQRGPHSQSTMKMLERAHFATRKVPLNDARIIAVSPEPSVPAQETNGANSEAPVEPRPPKLHRVTTVQDSQSEDLVLSRTPSKESPVKPARVLKRIHTVQDSQYDDGADLLFDTGAYEYQASYMFDNQEEEIQQYEDDNEEEPIFDPANSALDRDAARFGWTQTQQAAFSGMEQENANVDSETDDEDLDRGVPPPTAPQRTNFSSTEAARELVQLSSTPPPLNICEDYPPPKSTNVVHKSIEQLRPDSRDDSAYESGFDKIHPKPKIPSETIELPSSPPSLHPSQISTVVSTQVSIVRQVSHHSDTWQSPKKPDTTSTESLKIASSPSPQKSSALESAWPGMSSSSPLPVPPLSWQSIGLRNSGDELRSLVDYSLPPPPPMSSSSRRGTPMSSAR